MATIKTEITALIGRCRRVGWDVEQAGNEWKVTFDDHSVYLIHSSYSERAAPEKVLRHLKSKGLLDKEKTIAEKHEKDKSARLAAERKTADAKAVKMASQARLTNKAAGPYAGPERVPTEWFLEKHPAMWQRLVVIDPAQAAAIMARNVDNRPLKKVTVEHYARVIASGHWHLTHQGMAMDTRGVLQDGQHRLQACIDADMPIEVSFYVGCPVSNFKAIDEGRNRTVADLLGKDGEIDVTMLSTTTRLVAACRESNPRAFMRIKLPNEVLYDAFKGDPERLREVIKWGRGNAQEAKVVGSALSAARYLIFDANGWDNNFVEAYFAGLVSQTKGESRMLLDRDDPRLLLRRYFTNRREGGQRRMAALEQMALVVRTWNYVVAGTRGLKALRWSESQQEIPAVTVCKDRGRGASAVPEFLCGEFTQGQA